MAGIGAAPPTALRDRCRGDRAQSRRNTTPEPCQQRAPTRPLWSRRRRTGGQGAPDCAVKC